MVEFDLKSGAALPYATGSFDVVLCIETLEDLYPTDHIVTEIQRVLKKSGIAIIDVPGLDSFLNIGLLVLGFQLPGVECSRLRLLWWLYDGVSLKKEYLVVKAEKPA